MEKSLNKTHEFCSKKHIMGDAKAPMQDFCRKSATHRLLTQDWENPKISKPRRIKYLQRILAEKEVEALQYYSNQRKSS
jgi:hypothetical protein